MECVWRDSIYCHFQNASGQDRVYIWRSQSRDLSPIPHLLYIACVAPQDEYYTLSRLWLILRGQESLTPSTRYPTLSRTVLRPLGTLSLLQWCHSRHSGHPVRLWNSEQLIWEQVDYNSCTRLRPYACYQQLHIPNTHLSDASDQSGLPTLHHVALESPLRHRYSPTADRFLG